MTDEQTTSRGWRQLREEGTVATLKTGRVIRYRPIDLLDALDAGEIPDLLTVQILRTVWDSTGEDTRVASKQAKDWIGMLNLIAKLALISPAVVDEPQGDDQILPRDLGRGERKEIYDLATQPIDEVLRFRDQQKSDVDAVPDGDAGKQAAK